jgi:hypothetical protein
VAGYLILFEIPLSVGVATRADLDIVVHHGILELGLRFGQGSRPWADRLRAFQAPVVDRKIAYGSFHTGLSFVRGLSPRAPTATTFILPK